MKIIFCLTSFLLRLNVLYKFVYSSKTYFVSLTFIIYIHFFSHSLYIFFKLLVRFCLSETIFSC